MNKNSDYKIIAKVYGIVFAALLAMIGIVEMNFYQNNKIYETASYASINTVPSVLAIGNVLANFYALRISERDHILNQDQKKIIEIEKDIKKYTESIEKQFLDYEFSLISNNEDKQLLEIEKVYFESYIKSMELPLALSFKNKNTEAHNALVGTSDIAIKFEDALNVHLQFNKKLAAESTHNALIVKDYFAQASIMIAAFVLCAISFIGCLLLLFF